MTNAMGLVALTMLEVVLPILAAIGTIAFFIGIPFCIYFAIKAYNESDTEKRMRLVKKSLWIFFGPILLTFLSTAVEGLAFIFNIAF